MTRSPTSRQLGFAAWLARLAANEDRGTLAALRRGLMLDEEHLFELYGCVPPSFLVGLSLGDERLYLMVAALFGYHPVCFREEELKERRCNLGASLRMLALARAQRHSPDAGEGDDTEDLLPDSMKRRMEALLASHRDDLFGHLRQVIGLLKTEEVPVDWAQLLNDLQAWEWQGRPVQWQWSRSFYVGHHEKGGDENNVS
ncbi:MAG: type I-E CRISPR-associated protein Cse2/CasB [Bacillota bacterium]